MRKTIIYGGLCLLTSLATACSGNVASVSSLKKKIEQKQESLAPAKVEPVDEVDQFHLPSVDASELKDIFMTFEQREKLASIQSDDKGQTVIAPDLDRYKSPLEEIPLSQIDFVGVVVQDQRQWAVIEVPEIGGTFIVKKGDYLGQHHGKIDAISDQGITVKERIKTPMGHWTERQVTID